MISGEQQKVEEKGEDRHVVSVVEALLLIQYSVRVGDMSP